MVESAAIPLVVLSRQQDPVETINSTLRNAGHPVHCTWVRDVSGLGDALAKDMPQAIFLCVSDPDETNAALEARQRFASRVPTILVRDSITEADLTHALEIGAQDVVTLHARPRLQAVAIRELHSSRLDRALAGTLASARQYRDQMKAFMTGSTDAIAHVQEGIVVDVNPAWADLFGHEEAAGLLGQPLMDFFQQRSHAALKGALVAAAQGRWADHSLQAVALLPGGTELPVDIEFERFEFEGEPAVRLRVPTQKGDVETLSRQLDEALQFDAGTGLLKRAAFFEHASAHASNTLKAGLRALLFVEPDASARWKATSARSRSRTCSRPSGNCCTRCCNRETSQGASRRAALRCSSSVATGAISMHGSGACCSGSPSTCSTSVSGRSRSPAARVRRCSIRRAKFCRRPSSRRSRRLAPRLRPAATDCCGRNSRAKSRTSRKPIASGRRGSARRLMANRFRLVQQPIASLVGDGEAMYDLVVRMLDDKGNEVLPSEFLAAAQRTDLMKNIDRWVVGAAMSFCAARKPHRVFVRLSRDSMRDQTLGNWLQQQLKASGVDAGRVVFELGEALVTTHLKEMKELQALVQPLGFELAIENFGSGRDPAQLLSHIPLNYVKIDGALMQGLANDRLLQEQVKVLVQQARTKGVTTIAERVEDANTMAVLWQLGIEFIQGYFVSSPEEVVLGA